MDKIIVREYDSGVSGPHVAVLGGVHGNERVGIEAVRHYQGLISAGDFRLDSGRVSFVLANPRAIAEDVRYCDENLNRLNIPGYTPLGSYEAGLASQLRKKLDEADICLDLHSSTIEDMPPFVVCENNARELLPYLSPRVICSGFDEHEPGGTDFYMNQIGKVGICVETGYARAMEDVPKVVGMVDNLLRGLRMVPGEAVRYDGKVNYEVFKCYVPQGDFVLDRSFSSFELLGFGTKIGEDGGKVINAERDCRIIFSRSVDKKKMPNKEAFLLLRDV